MFIKCNDELISCHDLTWIKLDRETKSVIFIKTHDNVFDNVFDRDIEFETIEEAEKEFYKICHILMDAETDPKYQICLLNKPIEFLNLEGALTVILKAGHNIYTLKDLVKIKRSSLSNDKTIKEADIAKIRTALGAHNLYLEMEIYE